MLTRSHVLSTLGLPLFVACGAPPPSEPPPTAAAPAAPTPAPVAAAPTEQTAPAAAAPPAPANWSAEGPKLEDAPGTRECPKSLGGSESIDRVITKECGVVPVTKTYSIDNGTLTLGPGAQLAFADGTQLVIGRRQAAKLVVIGNEKEGVTFSSQGDKQPGVYPGIVLGRHSHRSYLGGLVVEHAGGDQGALNVASQDVTVVGSTFRSIKGTAVVVSKDGRLASFSHNTVSDADVVPLNLPPAAVGALGAGNQFAANARIQVQAGGIVDEARWQPAGAPYQLLGNVDVQGKGGAGASLELSAGTQLEFDNDAALSIGRFQSGKLTVSGSKQAPVRFGSSGEKKPGAWKNVIVHRHGTALVEHGVFEYGGGRDGKLGALTAVGGAELSVKNSLFQMNGSGVNVGKGVKLTAFEGNTFQKTPTALFLAPEHLGSLSADNSYDDGARILVQGGLITSDATLEVQKGARVEVDGALGVGGADVRVQPGYTLYIDNASIDVGRFKNASLSLLGTAAAPVTLAGLRDEPGAWKGVTYHRHARGNKLSHVVIQNAGREQGAVLFVSGSDAKVDTLTCKKCAGAAVEIQKDAKVEAKGVTPPPEPAK